MLVTRGLGVVTGGTGPGGSLVLFDGMEVEVTDRCVDVEVDFSSVEVEITSEVEVEVEAVEFDVEVCD